MSELRNPVGVCFNIKFLPAVTVSEVPRPPAAPPHSRLELQTIHRQRSVFTITEKAPTRVLDTIKTLFTMLNTVSRHEIGMPMQRSQIK